MSPEHPMYSITSCTWYHIPRQRMVIIWTSQGRYFFRIFAMWWKFSSKTGFTRFWFADLRIWCNYHQSLSYSGLLRCHNSAMLIMLSGLYIMVNLGIFCHALSLQKHVITDSWKNIRQIQRSSVCCIPPPPPPPHHHHYIINNIGIYCRRFIMFINKFHTSYIHKPSYKHIHNNEYLKIQKDR